MSVGTTATVRASPTMADALRSIVSTLRAAALLSEVAAVNYDGVRVSQGRGGHGKHGATTATHSFGRDLPLGVELERALARFADVWEARSKAAEASASTTAAKGHCTSNTRRAEKVAILTAVGQPAIELAYVYEWTEDGVRRARIAAGLDPATGERVGRQRAITVRGNAESPA